MNAASPIAATPTGIASPPVVATPREGSKLATVIGMLRGDGGATIEQLAAATDWLPHTTRAALTGLRKRGYELHRDRDQDARASRYWIAATQARAHMARRP